MKMRMLSEIARKMRGQGLRVPVSYFGKRERRRFRGMD
jgi:hypothetical protein